MRIKKKWNIVGTCFRQYKYAELHVMFLFWSKVYRRPILSVINFDGIQWAHSDTIMPVTLCRWLRLTLVHPITLFCSGVFVFIFFFLSFLLILLAFGFYRIRNNRTKEEGPHMWFQFNLMFTFVHKSCSACFVWWYSPNGELSIYHIYFHIAQKHTSAHEHALVRTGTTTHNHVCYLYHNRYTLIWVVFLVFVFIFALVVSGCCCRICSLSGTDGQIRN